MDDNFTLNAAVSAYRDAYNAADVDRLLALCSDRYVGMLEGKANLYGKGMLETDLRNIFAEYRAKLVLLVIENVFSGDLAIQRGNFELTLAPKAPGETILKSSRYLDVWQRAEDGGWKLLASMTNTLPPGW